jgi:hypothetical protein
LVPLRAYWAVDYARAMLRLKGGDFDGFMSDIGALEQLARGMQNGGRVTERSTGYLADGTAMAALGGAAGSGQLTVNQCVKLWQWLDGLGEPAAPEESFDVNQRWSMLERACLVATGKAATWTPALGKIEAGQVNWDAALKRMNVAMDERIAHLKKATMQELMEFEEKRWKDREEQGKEDLSRQSGETAEAYTERVAMNLSGAMYYGGWGGAEYRYRIAEMKRKMGRLMVGLAAYHAEKGSWPDSLAQLKPEYVKEIPLDIYSEKGKEEVRYAHGSGGARVYSVGTNGKDDGGLDQTENRGTRGDDIVVGVQDAAGGRKVEE